MSSFLAELAGEATQKLEAQRAQQQDRQVLMENVHAALDRTFQFFNLFTQHLNAIEPDVPRIYALDGKAQFSRLKWKRGPGRIPQAEPRGQRLAGSCLLSGAPGRPRAGRGGSPLGAIRRARQGFAGLWAETLEDMHELWRNRPQKVTFQIGLEPEFLIRMRFQGNYADGSIALECNNLDGFGAMKAKVKPELLRPAMFDEIGRFLMGRSGALPQELALVRDFSRNL